MSVVLKITREQDTSLPTIKVQGLFYPVMQCIDFATPSYRIYGPVRSPSLLSDILLANVCGFYAFGHRGHTDKLLLLANTPSFKKSRARKIIDYDLLPRKFIDESKGIMAINEGNDTFFKSVEHILLDPYFSPILADDKDLKRFPKTYVLTAEYDVLRDEGYMIVKRLENNGIPVIHRHWPYDGHGLLSLTRLLDNAVLATEEISDFLIEHL